MSGLKPPADEGQDLASRKDSQAFLRQLNERADRLKPGDSVSAEDYTALVRHLEWLHARFSKVLEISDKYQEIITSYADQLSATTPSRKEPSGSRHGLAPEALVEKLQACGDPDVLALVRKYERMNSRMNKILAISDNYQNLLRDASIKLEVLAKTDPLTRLSNRLDMIGHLELQRARMARSDTSYSVMLFDVDFFKRVNDTYGHDTGDTVLVSLADYFRQALRRTDYCSRWGGEEFLILCPDTRKEQAFLAAEKIRLGVGSMVINTPAAPLSITLSGGVAEPSDMEESWEHVVNRADQGLYQAKREGRNKIVVL